MTARPDPAPVRPTHYAALGAGWGALLGAVLVAAREKGDEPVQSAEVLPLGLATFALSKLVAKVEGRRLGARAVRRGARRRPAPEGTGVRYAVGEILTCTRCVGVWSALGLTALLVTRPREARVATDGPLRGGGQFGSRAALRGVESITEGRESAAAPARAAPAVSVVDWCRRTTVIDHRGHFWGQEPP
jgi:hypothetical protein